MKNLSFSFLILSFLLVGCNLFSDPGNQTAVNNSTNSNPTTNQVNKTSIPETNVSPAEEREFTRDDYIGRWKHTVSYADHVIEFREDGTGTITLEDGSTNQAKQNFTWKYEAKHAVFTIKSPVVNKKFIDSGTLELHTKVIEDGKKLKTDFSAFTRTKGDDVFEKQ